MTEHVHVRPTVFISHDNRDSKIAESFAHLLEDATANVIGTFRSSDKTGKDGIPFGDDWFQRVLEGIDRASDVVCLLTPNSCERPWVIFEAAYAMGRHDKRVYGLVLGMDVSRVTNGSPFARFQNCTDDPVHLASLITDIASRVEHCSPTSRVLDGAVATFQNVVSNVQKRLRRTFGPRHPRKVHHVSLPVRDLARSVLFYRSDVGLKRIPRKRLKFKVPGAWFEVPDGQQLHLIENPKGTYRQSDTIDYNDCHFALRVPDLSAAYDRLSKQYVTRVNEDIAFHRYPHFYVLDPDRHVIEVNADNLGDKTLFRQYYKV